VTFVAFVVLLANEVLGFVGAPGSSVRRDLRIGAQRPRAHDLAMLDARGGLNSAYYGKKKTTPIDILVKRQVANKPESAALQAAVKKAAT